MQQTYAAELTAAKARPCSDCGAAAFEDCGPDCLAGESYDRPVGRTIDLTIALTPDEFTRHIAAIRKSGLCEDCAYDAAAGIPSAHAACRDLRSNGMNVLCAKCGHLLWSVPCQSNSATRSN